MATNTDEFKGLRHEKNGDRYECPWEKWKRPGLLALGRWKFRTKDNTCIPPKEKLDETLPVIPVDQQKLKLNNPPKDGIQVMWIGHASVLFQFDGATILADPVFSDICGPVNHGFSEQWGMFGYRRYRNASCSVEDLPEIDAVIISHNHYDHLDKPTVIALNEKFPNCTWYVGEGLGSWFESLKCNNVHQLTWWDQKPLTLNPPGGEKKFNFICTAAQHWCGRGPRDENKCLWCSWIVEGPSGKKIFFAGDTGYYGRLFKKIGEKYGPFDLSALPIGAYEPREITRYQHADPREAVQMHVDIRSKTSIGIHWGTFNLTNEFYLEPPHMVEQEMGKAFKAQIEKNGDAETIERLEPRRFQCLNHGEIWMVGSERPRPKFMPLPNRL